MKKMGSLNLKIKGENVSGNNEIAKLALSLTELTDIPENKELKVDHLQGYKIKIVHLKMDG